MGGAVAYDLTLLGRAPSPYRKGADTACGASSGCHEALIGKDTKPKTGRSREKKDQKDNERKRQTARKLGFVVNIYKVAFRVVIWYSHATKTL